MPAPCLNAQYRPQIRVLNHFGGTIALRKIDPPLLKGSHMAEIGTPDERKAREFFQRLGYDVERLEPVGP